MKLWRQINIELSIFSLSSFLFCILALVVLCYFIRRRYLLAIDIKNISQDDLIRPGYRNHLKNLEIKSMIANFIISILIVEFLFNFTESMERMETWRFDFKDSVLFDFLHKSQKYLYHINVITFNCHLSIPCLFLKVLWLVYLHCPYRYTIMRWTGWIVIRCVFFFSIKILDNLGLAIYHREFQTLYNAAFALVLLIDFVLYLLYSRRFYKHMKSREIEAKLFKDRKSYLAERSIRRHFKVSSILVAVAFFCFSISRVFYSAIGALEVFPDIESSGIFATFLNDSKLNLIHLYRHEILALGLTLYSLIFILNYLYFVTMIVGRFLLQKWRLTHINQKIKPIVRAYHNSLYYHW